MALGIKMIYIIKKRPYLKSTDNFSIAFNQFSIIFTFLWTFGKGTTIDNF